MKNKFAFLVFAVFNPAIASTSTILDFGSLIGTWKTVDSDGVDVAPGLSDPKVEKGAPTVEVFYGSIFFHSELNRNNWC